MACETRADTRYRYTTQSVTCQCEALAGAHNTIGSKVASIRMGCVHRCGLDP